MPRKKDKPFCNPLARSNPIRRDSDSKQQRPTRGVLTNRRIRRIRQRNLRPSVKRAKGHGCLDLTKGGKCDYVNGLGQRRGSRMDNERSSGTYSPDMKAGYPTSEGNSMRYDQLMCVCRTPLSTFWRCCTTLCLQDLSMEDLDTSKTSPRT